MTYLSVHCTAYVYSHRACLFFRIKYAQRTTVSNKPPLGYLCSSRDIEHLIFHQQEFRANFLLTAETQKPFMTYIRGRLGLQIRLAVPCMAPTTHWLVNVSVAFTRHCIRYLNTASSSSCGLFVAPMTSTLSSPPDCT